MNEAETRAELIDPALKTAGWGVVDGSPKGVTRRRPKFFAEAASIDSGGTEAERHHDYKQETA